MSKDKPEFNPYEQEVVGLCIALEAIDNFLNKALLSIHISDDGKNEGEARFQGYAERDLFLIRALDFLLEKGDESLLGLRGSSIDFLSKVSRTPIINPDGISSISKPLTDLKGWLDSERTLKLWLPSLDTEAELRVNAQEILSISGNQVKHNLSRLTRVAKKIHKLLKENGYEVDIPEIPLALEDFEEHLNDNFFGYHATELSKLLNDLRWGLYNYLCPTFYDSYTTEDPKYVLYSFKIPDKINSPLTKAWFWRLMNHVRMRPIFDRFISSPYLSGYSSLERDFPEN